jgi:hypothetical protein
MANPVPPEIKQAGARALVESVQVRGRDQAPVVPGLVSARGSERSIVRGDHQNTPPLLVLSVSFSQWCLASAFATLPSERCALPECEVPCYSAGPP